MVLAPRLDLRQSQQLVLTPQLQQAIKLLQMPNLDLQSFVQQEIERNPLLEPASPEGEGAEETQAVNGEVTPLSGFDTENGIYGADAGLAGDGMVSTSDAPLDAEFEGTVFDDAPVDSAGGSSQLGFGAGSGAGSRNFGEEPDLESRLTQDLDLKSHLAAQMELVVTAPEDRLIAAHLVDLLDEAGYLTEDTKSVAERLGCGQGDVERVLERLQTLDPTGVFARNLAECLRLQLVERDRCDPAMEALLGHLDLLAQRDHESLKRICGVDDEDLMEMIRELRALDPRPGYAFGGTDAQTVIPDVFLKRTRQGSWSVELNSETLPRVLVNRHYYAELSAQSDSKDDKQYLSECLADANWLVRALDQRARTILKVAREIVRRQDGFFTEGVTALKPLTLRMIADAIDMHESTVSRVTSGKYLATGRGVFELKYFFTSALRSADGGDAHSSEAVRARIRSLIDSEDPKKILSDDRIVDILKQDGITVARRTVAKYREAMGISSSVERRRAKRLSG